MNIKNIGMNTFTSRSKRQATSNIVTKGFGFSWLKQAIVLLALLMVSSGVWGQTTFTRTLAGNENWTAVTWTITGNPTSATYPGQVAGENHIVVINCTGNNATGRTMTLNANITQSVSAVSINYSGTRTCALAIGNSTLTMSGNLSGNGILTFGNGTLNIAGNNTHSGTFTRGTGTVNYNGTVAQSARNTTYNHLKINNAAGVTLSGATTVTTLTIGDVTPASILNDGGFQLTSTGTINLTSGTFKLGSVATATTWPAFATRNFAVGTTVEYGSGADQSVAALTDYRNLTISGANTKTLQGTTAVTGNLNISNSTLATGNNPLTLQGDFTNTGTFTAGSSNIILAGTAAQSIAGFTTTGTTSMTKTGGTATLQSALSSGNLTLNGVGGTLSLGSGLTHNVSGAVTITNGTLNGGSSTLNIAGTFTGSAFTASTSTVNFNAAVQSVPSNTYYNLTASGSGVKTATGALTVNGALNIASGVTLDLAGNALSGSLTSVTSLGAIKTANTSATPVPAGKNWESTFEYSAPSGGQTIVGGNYHNLTLSNTSGSNSTSGDIVVDDAFALTTGLALNTTHNVVFNGTTTCGGLINATAGTVTYSATATNILAGTYNNLAIYGNATYCGAVTVTGTLTINGSLNIGSNNLTLNTTACGTGSITATGGTVTYSSGATNILPGTYNNLTTQSSGLMSLCGHVTVNGLLANTGNLSLGVYNLTLANGADFSPNSGYSSSRMVITESTGLLIKQSNTSADFVREYPVGTGSYYTPMVISSLTATPSGTASVSVRAVPARAASTSVTDLNKHWEVQTSNLASITANVSFAYNNGEVNGTQTEYLPKYSASIPATAWIAPTGASAAGVNPISSTGTTSLTGTWTARENVVNWYALASGDWNNPDIWTLDPSGSVPVNPSNSYPQLATDNASVKSGKTVIVNINDLTVGTVTIDGRLEMATATNTTFGALKGTGRIILIGDNFPAGDATNFISAGQGEGTVVLSGNSFTLDNPSYEFYNFEVDMTAGQIATINSNLTVNGNLQLVSGSLNIDGTSARTVTVNKDITINSGTSFGVGSGAAIHWLEARGNFTNNGTINFSNAAHYSDATSAVKLKFTGSSNNLFACNGVTNLYRMFVDKGIDKSYILDVTASNANNFKLFGPIAGGAGVEAGDGAGGWERLALVINHGTLKLATNVNIPRLGENRAGTAPNEFSIPADAGLWINGAIVASSDAAGGWRGTTLLGTLRVSSGSFTNPANTGGITYFGNTTIPGTLWIDGGTVNTTQLKDNNGTGKFSYVQSAGQLNITALSDSYNSSAIFALPQAQHTFEMTGGTITIDAVNSTTTNGIDIRVQEGNYNVTGGTIVVRTPTYNYAGQPEFKIYSTAPLYNLTIGQHPSNSGVQTVNLVNNLTLLGNLTIGDNRTLIASGYTLSLAGDLTLNSGALFTQTTGVLEFIGAKNSVITNVPALLLNDLVLNKELLSGSFYEVATSGGAGTVTVNGSITITEGELNVSTKNLSLKGNVEIISGNIISEVAGVASTGTTVLSGTTEQTLKGKLDAEQSFGAITITNTTNDVKLLSDVNVTNFTMGTRKVNLDNNNLTVSGTLSGATATAYFYTSGLSSDRGLTLGFAMNGAYTNASIITFPVGVTSYTPLEVKANGTTASTSGFLTVIPVNSAHPATDVGKLADVIPYYWKTKVSGFSTLTPSVISLEFDYNGTIDTNHKVSYLEGALWTEGPNAGTRYAIFNSATPLTKFINGDFTTGKTGAFKQIDVFYSVASGDWFTGNVWSLSVTGAPLTGKIPAPGDIVYIRNGHRINVSSGHSIDIGLLEFQHDTTVNHGIEDLPRLQVDVNNTVKLTTVKGTGIFTQWLNNTSDPVVSGDFGDFANQKYSWFLFVASAANVNIPTTYSTYPGVMTEGDGNTLTFTNDVTINRSLNPRGNSIVRMNSGTNGNIYVGGNLLLGDWLDGKLQFASTGTARTLTVAGNIDYTSAVTSPTNGRAIEVLNTTPSSLTHKINLYGNIIQGVGILDLSNVGATANNATLEFLGTTSATVTKTASEVTDFNRIIINKSTGKNVAFNNTFTLGGATDGTTKALTLTSGECHLNNSSININLSTGGANFKIPSGSTLRVDNGSRVNIGGSASNTGMWLDGSLIVDNGGKAYLNQGTGSYQDNFIEYTASGTASIWLGNNAELFVGSQIRRSLSTDAGSLIFTQNRASSNVVIGYNAGPSVANSRGMFEILNTGSSFTQSEANSTITIARGQGTTTPDFYFAPTTSSIATGSSFTIGHASATPVATTVNIYASTPLKNLVVSSFNSPTAKLVTVPMTITENLTINGGTLNANGLALTLNGNFTNSGTFAANGNTTYFTGSASQTITGSATFYNLTKQTTSNALLLGVNSPITVDNTLTLTSGTFNTGANNVNAKGDVVSSIVVSSSGASEGIVFNGTQLQYISGAGTYARLTVNNASGIKQDTENDGITITDELRMQRGILDIGKNKLTITAVGEILPINPFSETNMIRTNLSYTDNGILRYLLSGASTVVYPIGSEDKYTPVTLTVTANGNSTGYIRVRAANERNITIVNDTETPEINDLLNVLQYYWSLDANGISGFAGTAVMKAYPEDVWVTNANGSTYTASDYIAARLLQNSTDWEKNFPFNSVTNELEISFLAGSGDGQIDGAFTAGISEAIPDKVPSYITTKDGDWTDVSVWSQYDPLTSTIGAPATGVPRGSLVYINHILTTPTNFMAAYRTNIMANGVLSTGATFGHRLGDVSGTGKIKLTSGDLPSGVYDDFLAATGGTLEFAGTTNYDILSELSTVNNVELTGIGNRRFANLPLQLYGSLTINGANAVNEHSKTISVAKNFNFTSGGFIARNGKIILNGTALQSIGGASSFTGINSMYDLVINNSSNVTLASALDVTNKLTLTAGLLNTSASNMLSVTNASLDIEGGSSTVYINGPIRKNMNAGTNLTFHIGKSGRYGQISTSSLSSAGYWEAEYFNTNPDAIYDVDSFVDPVVYVSHNEYWRVKAPIGGATSGVTMNWDSSSGVTPDGNFKVVVWTDLPTDAWSKIDINAPSGTSASGSVSISSPLTFGFSGADNNHYLTFGAIVIPAYTWDGSESSDWFAPLNWSNDIVPSASSNATIASASNNPIISGSIVAQANDLTIQAGATLTLNAGSKLTVNRNLSIADVNALILMNAPDVLNEKIVMSSLITYGSVPGTGTGTTRVETTMPLGARYWYYGFSVHGTDVNTGIWNALDIVNTFAYKYSSNIYTRFADNGTLLGDNPITGLLNGYSVKLLGSGTTTLVAQGVLNNGNITTTLPNNSWNLLCNPYPSALDMLVVYNNNSSSFGAGKLDPTIWVPTNATGSTVQSTYNLATQLGANGGTSILAPTQGYWVKNTNTVGQTFAVLQSARLHEVATTLKSLSAPVEEDILRLELVGATMTDEMVVGFRDIGSVDVTMYDSQKRLNSGTASSNIYSLKGGTSLVINMLPVMGVDTVIIPLGVNVGTAGAGNYTIKGTNLTTFDSKLDVFVIDYINDLEFNLREMGELPIALTAGINNNRFALKFAPKSGGIITNIPDFSAASASNDVVITQQGSDVLVTIPGNIEPNAIVELYGVEGQLIRVKKQLEKVTRIHLPNDNSVYVVRVTNNGKVKSAKVVSMGR